MRNFAAIIASAPISLAASTALAEAPGFVFSQDKLEWRAAPPKLPRGADVAMLFGDPMQGGHYLPRMRAPKGRDDPRAPQRKRYTGFHKRYAGSLARAVDAAAPP